MKNITVFAVLVIILFGIQATAAQENYAVSLSYQAGFLYGQAEETVYPFNTKAELLSQLLWDIKPVFYNGLLLDFSQTKPMEKWGGFAGLSFKYGIPGGSGTMEDRDWMSKENDALTHFSSHDNNIKELFLLDVLAGFSFPLHRIVLLRPFLTASYMRFYFSGTDGYGIYARSLADDTFAPIDDNPNRRSFSGKVINYTQDWLYIAPGFTLRFYMQKRFSAGLSFQISPLVFYTGLDEHLTTQVQYKDYVRFGLFLKPEAGISFSFIEWLSLSLECSWRYIKETRGQSYQRVYGFSSYAKNGEAGAGLSMIDTVLCLKIRL